MAILFHAGIFQLRLCFALHTLCRQHKCKNISCATILDHLLPHFALFSLQPFFLSHLHAFSPPNTLCFISTCPVTVPCLRCSPNPVLHPCLHLCCAPAAAESRENSFSRSRSSSVSSIDRDTKEAITTLQFGESYGRKGDAVPTPCLWVGTSLGVVLLIPMSIATDEDERMEEPVAIGPSGRSQSRTAKAGYVKFLILF